MPLTPQVISSINLLHQQQQEQCVADKNPVKSKTHSKSSRPVKAKQTLEINMSKDSSENALGKPSKCTTLPLDGQTLPISSDVPSSTTMMTVQPPLTIDFNDLNGYFTTTSASANQPNQEGDYMIYKLI